MKTKHVLFFIFFSLGTSLAIAADKRPCGEEIDKCIRETRSTELGGCLGTAYGLYFAGEERISNCRGGKYTSSCLNLDQAQAISHCFHLGNFPKSCTTDVMKCIVNFDNEP